MTVYKENNVASMVSMLRIAMMTLILSGSFSFALSLNVRGPAAPEEVYSSLMQMDARAPDLPKVDVPKTGNIEVPKAPETFPVPTASRCVVIICVQYMIVYATLAICRTYHELSGTGK